MVAEAVVEVTYQIERQEVAAKVVAYLEPILQPLRAGAVAVHPAVRLETMQIPIIQLAQVLGVIVDLEETEHVL
jgi:hypothetical protein